MTYIDEFYESHNEDERLTSQSGSVEYITTLKYINEYAKKVSAKSILEIGAGTGRYSIALANEGFNVTAVELTEHNISVLKQKSTGNENLTTIQGNALDLSFLPDNSFDITLSLGPMYHLYTKENKIKALNEAIRVTKPNGYILVAYCMNEPTIVQFVFLENHLNECLEKNMLKADWHCKSEEKDVFELVRTEDIEQLNKELSAKRVKIVATDGMTNYFKQNINDMNKETFNKWLDFHLKTCERQDIIGASNHTLDILRKE